MGTKQSSRRRFLQKGAALAGLAATPAGLAVAPRAAGGQTRGSAVPDMNSMEYVLYGQRSRFVDSERILEGHNHHEVHRPRPDPYRRAPERRFATSSGSSRRLRFTSRPSTTTASPTSIRASTSS